ncbi:OsmC family protein, partial [Zoogloea sp.]|uniref:OsmC family protein n=1 Tax=Zoogloea sp. TaxID=49181 RepID=UPI00261946E5
MECVVKWVDGMTFMAETGSGHTVTMDGAPEAGGRNLAARPMELMLAGAGGCTAFDVVLILKRSRQDVTDCAVSLKAERAETEPKVFTRIAFHYTVSGR